MVYREEQGDLFELEKTHYLAHCVSRDYALGAGIAVEFVRRYNMRTKLHYSSSGSNCIMIGQVFNLVTKEKCWQKPTYESLQESLNTMKDMIKRYDVGNLAMPKIGCGIDGLTWGIVSHMIQETFEGLPVEIVIRYL